MSRIQLVEHLARVEGNGGITVELENGAVTDVQFNVLEGPRLLEELLRGQPYMQVAPILSRICAICSVAHALTSLAATERAFGVQVSEQTELLRELLFRGENIESHALHVFLLALPDYFGAASAPALAKSHPDAVALGLELKALGNAIQETIGGRAIHPVIPLLGGMSFVPDEQALERLRHALADAREKMRMAVDLVAALPADDVVDAETNFAALEMPAEYGYYGSGDSIVAISPAGRRRFAAAEYRALTNERPVAHAYAKHSMLDGAPIMVGALARLTINRRRLSPAGLDAVGRLGLVLPSGDPTDNTRAQVVELVMDVERSLAIVEALLASGARVEAPIAVQPRAGVGTAVTEAPRGLLVHSYEYDDAGRIVAADVVTPTAINAASIEYHFRESVARAPQLPLDAVRTKLERIARAYDPCISCSVHLVVRNG
ncbi:MAG TPA: Ni/Fe hydrogenase subunit alpha [Gemmatimonadaceae bacterium]|nr:Ni/Fe hydrogenase subunit alpha [Gemmatimonadaceae bacterium]